RDRPSRFVLPITALRLTPSSRAICPDENPAHIRSFRSAMRSIVHVVSIIVLASITPNAAVHTPPPQVAVATHGALVTAGMDPAAPSPRIRQGITRGTLADRATLS